MMTAAKKIANAFVGRLDRAMTSAADRTYRAGYDAVEDRGRRKPASPITRSEDAELWPAQRRKLISGTRDLRRNFTIAAWAIRKHLDYVSTFKFMPKTGDAGLDDELQNLVAWWSRPINCDMAARHSLPRMVRLLEEHRTVDGDVLLNLLSDGHMQIIEGDRVRTPTSGLPDGLTAADFKHGVKLDAFGKVIGYAVCDRPKADGGALVFGRMLSPAYTRQLGYYSRADQVRGVSPLAPAINSFRDVYENFDYALAKAKIANLFGLVTTRDATAGLGSVEASESDDGGPRYKVNLGGGGPFYLDLDRGDDAKILESETPSTQFQQFAQEMIVCALKALDIPGVFYDEGRANYSSGRQAWLLYDQSAQSKRQDLRELLDYVIAWRIKLWLIDGTLTLPPGFDDLRKIRWEWVHAGIPWMDPSKEAAANAMELGLGLTSRQRICKERGEDFFEIADEQAEEVAYVQGKGITITAPVSVSATPPPPPAPAPQE